MSLRIAILTPDPEGELGGTRWPGILSRLVAPLEAAGMRVESSAWTRAGDGRVPGPAAYGLAIAEKAFALFAPRH